MDKILQPLRHHKAKSFHNNKLRFQRYVDYYAAVLLLYFGTC
jgi:hypothetical protein